LAGLNVTPRSHFIIGILAVGYLAGCTGPKDSSFAFLGIPESESSDLGPVGLINQKPYQVRNVTTVTETSYEQYERIRQAGRIFAEQAHGDYVYYAVKQQRDVHFENASAWVEVIERFKARKP
jgi:hypothetical protein